VAGGAGKDPGGASGEGYEGPKAYEGPGYWAEKFDLIRSEYGWIPDNEIQEMKYFRFCQTIDAIYKRIDKERKYIAMVEEITTRFLASIIGATSPLSDKGALQLSDTIRKFTIFNQEPKDNQKPKKKELPTGGYETAMAFFSGMEGG